MPHPPAFPQPSPQKPDKDPGLPTYDGNGDASEFFTTVEEIFEAKMVSAQGQLAFTKLALKGTARQLVREKKPTSYLDLKALILNRFKLPNEEYHLITKLRTLVQNDDDLEKYIKDLHRGQSTNIVRCRSTNHLHQWIT